MRRSHWMWDLARALGLACAVSLGTSQALAQEGQSDTQSDRSSQSQRDDDSSRDERSSDRSDRSDDESRDDDSSSRSRSSRDDDDSSRSRSSRDDQSRDDERSSQRQRSGARDEEQQLDREYQRSQSRSQDQRFQDDRQFQSQGRSQSQGRFQEDQRFQDDRQRGQFGSRSDERSLSGDRGQRSQRGGQQELGAEFESDDEGLSVSSVESDSMAYRAGLREGDRVVSIQGRRIRSEDDLNWYLQQSQGRQVPVIIDRDGQRYTVRLMGQQSFGQMDEQFAQQDDRAWLGVYLDEEHRGEGVRVTQVYPEGPAARAGLRPGDIITEIDGDEVSSADDVTSAIDEMSPQDEAELTVRRGDREGKLTARLASRNQFAQRYQQQQQGRFGQFEDRGYGRASFEGDRSGQPIYDQYGQQQFSQQQRGGQSVDVQRLQQEVRDLRRELRELRDMIEDRR